MSEVPPRPVAARLTPVPVRRIRRDREDAIQDFAAVEEPLEVRLHGRSFAVIMRTPGDDRALTAGFLLSEGVVTGAEDLGAVEHCKHPDHPEAHNIVDVYLHGQAASGLARVLDERRNIVTNSSCGMCGRVTIESLQKRLRPVDVTWTMKRDVTAALPERLRERQVTFAETGGLHAAGLFRHDGTFELMAEDVGRHNAVDKVVGAMVLADRLPLGEFSLVVSGRTSFEIVQKAWVAGIALVCAVSAPSSLAIELAQEAGITLLGFVRDGGFNVYTHPHRIDSKS